MAAWRLDPAQRAAQAAWWRERRKLARAAAEQRDADDGAAKRVVNAAADAIERGTLVPPPDVATWTIRVPLPPQAPAPPPPASPVIRTDAVEQHREEQARARQGEFEEYRRAVIAAEDAERPPHVTVRSWGELTTWVGPVADPLQATERVVLEVQRKPSGELVTDLWGGRALARIRELYKAEPVLMLGPDEQPVVLLRDGTPGGRPISGPPVYLGRRPLSTMPWYDVRAVAARGATGGEQMRVEPHARAEEQSAGKGAARPNGQQLVELPTPAADGEAPVSNPVAAEPASADAERVGDGGAAPPSPAQPSCSTDFTSVDWYGTRYTFSKGRQAEAVRALWEAWKSGGHSLSQETIGERLGVDGRFELSKVFRRKRREGGYEKHAAWGTMIQSDGKGCYRLVPPDSAESAKNPH
jgi:hypothetical protein